MSDAKAILGKWWTYLVALIVGCVAVALVCYFAFVGPSDRNLADSIANARANLAISNQRLADAQSTNNRLAGEFRDAGITNQHLAGELDSSRIELTNARQSITAATSRVIELEAELRASQSAVADLANALGSSQTALNGIADSTRQFTAELGDASATASSLTGFLRQLGAILGFSPISGGDGHKSAGFMEGWLFSRLFHGSR